MSEQKGRRKGLSRLKKQVNVLGRGAQNALELLREGRLAAPYSAPFEVIAERPTFRLRRYAVPEGGPVVSEPLLLVPPLMVSSEIYDISPELSSVALLRASGLDVWVCDFGAPETEAGGMLRTLDDHVLAVDEAIELVLVATGHAVHLAGYSQGGMFCYQAAAYRASRGLASVITFGSPVDLRRNLPVAVHDSLAERFLKVARSAVKGPLQDLEGLPSAVTAGGFKMLSPRKEVQQLVGLFGMLPNRQALEAREPKRRFLNGEGFVAWPGPAFRKFVEDMVADNRMMKGGFVIQGRTCALSDITVPVLAFVGERDDMARPPSVRAIRGAAPSAEVHLVHLEAGHFGLVIGTVAATQTWPTVSGWMHWRAGLSEPPELVRPPGTAEGQGTETSAAPVAVEADATGVQALYDVATDVIDGLWHRLGDVSLEVAVLVDTMRWQLPRLARLKSLHDNARINLGRALEEQARAIPDETFFLWKGRAFTWAEANARVNDVLAALLHHGMRSEQHVGVLMHNRPDYLTTVTAVNRASAVGVLLNAGLRGRSLRQAMDAGAVTMLVCDAEHAEEALAAVAGAIPVLVLDRGRGEPLAEGAIDLDATLAREDNRLPAGFLLNAGLARDTALLMFTSGTTGLPKAARITNRRWAMASLGAAAMCRLTQHDTVYCCLPLHHATGMLIAVGGAMIGGCRLALAPRFSAHTFWNDVRRYGATVVFYVGELCRYLVNAPPSPNAQKHPVRLFSGNGMRADIQARMRERFGPVQIIEFYGSTEGNLALANLRDDKPGSVGRPILDVGTLELLIVDVETGAFLRDPQGRYRRAGADEPGVLVSRLETDHPLARFDGYLDPEETERKILRDVIEAGDAWYVTGDLMRRDADGDFWFVDRLGDTFRWKGENVSTEQVAATVRALPFVAGAAAYGVALADREGRVGCVAIQLQEGASFDGDALFEETEAHLFEAARPIYARVVEALETTGTHKTVKARLRDEGVDPARVSDALYVRDEEGRTYVALAAPR